MASGASIVLTFSTQVWHTHRSRNTFFFVHFSYCCSILFVCHFWVMMDTQTYVCPHTHTELLSPGTILIDACTAVSKQFVPLLPTEWEDECLPSLLYHEPPLLSLSHLSVSPPLYFLLFLWSFLSTALNARPMSWATSSSSPCHCIKLSLDQYLLLFISLLYDTTYSFLLKLVALIPHVYTERIPNHGSQLSLK